MKAILCNDGDLEIILETETEVKSLKSTKLVCDINREGGEPIKKSINTVLTLSYNPEGKYKDGIKIEPADVPFVGCNTTTISIDTLRYNILSNKFLTERKIGTSRGRQHIGIYSPGEFTPFAPSQNI
ncbi:MAG: hypothetical protein ABIH65_00220 [Nanoarchaeota archaeon]